jgi:hypothetical protein
LRLSTIREICRTPSKRIALKTSWISFDGKSLKNTVSNYDNAKQNLINCVSAFSHQRKLVLGVKMMENKHESEINLVRDLIKLLDLTGVVFTFDALHCQKKLDQRSLIQEMIT